MKKDVMTNFSKQLIEKHMKSSSGFLNGKTGFSDIEFNEKSKIN
jgi:hypothetical protein